MCWTWLAGNAGPKKSPKIRHLSTIAQLRRAISSQLRYVSTVGKNLLNINTSSTCAHNMVNFGPLRAENGLGVWGTPANLNGFRVLAALLHVTLVVGVRQTLRSWTEGAIYIRQGGHHVWHWPTFSFYFSIDSIRNKVISIITIIWGNEINKLQQIYPKITHT